MLACSMRVKPRERERRSDTRIRQYDNSTIRQYVNTSCHARSSTNKPDQIF